MVQTFNCYGYMYMYIQKCVTWTLAYETVRKEYSVREKQL